MEKLRFDHLIYSHAGEYMSLASDGFSKDVISSISSREPRVEPGSLAHTGYCLFQTPVDDNLIAVGRLERAQTDRGPFVHHHTIVVKNQDYIKFSLHPAVFQENFISYADFKEHLSSRTNLQPLEISLNGHHDRSAAVLAYFQDKSALTSVLDAVISLALSDNRSLKLDFPSMEQAAGFGFLMMYLVPPHLRPVLSFVAGVEPENAGRFKMVLRISSREVYTLANIRSNTRHPLSADIASSVFSGRGVEPVHNAFEEMWNSLSVIDPGLTNEQVLHHILDAYPRPSLLKPVITTRIQELSAEGNLDRALDVAGKARIVWNGVEEIEELERGIALEHNISRGAVDQSFLAFPFPVLLDKMEHLIQTGRAQREQIVPFFVRKPEAFNQSLDPQHHPRLYHEFRFYTVDTGIRSLTVESLRSDPALGLKLVELLSTLQPSEKEFCARNLLTRIQNLQFHPVKEMQLLLSETADNSASLLVILPGILLKLYGIVEKGDLAAAAGEYCHTLTRSMVRPKTAKPFWDRTLGRTVFAFDPVRLERAIQMHLYDLLVELRNRFGAERSFSTPFKRFTDIRGELLSLNQKALKGKG